MIPWVWFRTYDVHKLAYVLVVNGLFWFAMIPELKQFLQLKKEGEIPDEQQVAEFMGMGSVYRLVKRFSFVSLIKRKNIDDA